MQTEGINKEENNYFHKRTWRKSFSALIGGKNCFHTPRLVPLHLHSLVPKAKPLQRQQPHSDRWKKRKIFLQFLGILAQVSPAVTHCVNEHSQCHWVTLSTQKALNSTQWSHIASLLWALIRVSPLPKGEVSRKTLMLVSQPGTIGLNPYLLCSFATPFSQGCISHAAVPHWLGEFIWRLREATARQFQPRKGKAEMPLHSTCWGDLLLLS